MKTIIAAVLAASGAAIALSAPARAESTYWQERWQNYESTPEYRYFKNRERMRAHPDVRISKRARYDRRVYVERDDDDWRRRSYNGPAYQTQEQVQQSVYDFATGGSGAIDKYR